MIPNDASRDELEQLYRRLLAAVIQLAIVLGKPCPVSTRKERRLDRTWNIDFEINGTMPALDTPAQQAQVAIEVASIGNRLDATKIRQLLDAGLLTTECVIDGRRVSLVLKSYGTKP